MTTTNPCAETPRNHGSADNAHRRRPTVAEVAAGRIKLDSQADAAAVEAILAAVDLALGQLGRSRTRKLLIQAWEAI